MSRNEHYDELDRAVAAVTEEPIDQAIIASAAARVWERLSRAGAPAGAQGSAQGEERGNAPASPLATGAGLRGCADFQSMIPAYLRGELTPARALLIEDHTRSCVPCRRALRQAREARGRDQLRSNQLPGRDPAPSDQSFGRDPAPSARSRRMPSLAPRIRWAAAAALAAALGAGMLWLAQQILPPWAARAWPGWRGSKAACTGSPERAAFPSAQATPWREERRSAPPRTRGPWCA
jgi:Putative zinc-finger